MSFEVVHRLARPGRVSRAYARSLFTCAASFLSLSACIAVAPTGIHRVTSEGSGGSGGGITFGTGGGGAPPANLMPDGSVVDPHAVLGTNPSHGPFTGGGTVLITGNGFSSAAQVSFGSTQVAASQTTSIDPTKVQVVVPPGKAGTVDVSVQDGTDTSTLRTLLAGYTYDALYAVPNSGPIAGGTVIQILGQGTSWSSATVALIDEKPCVTLTVNGPTELTCTVPADTQGGKTIRVTTGSESILVLDAYTYEDTTNGYLGGLSGAPLAGQLKVLVYDNYTGAPVPDAPVIVGTDLATALQATTDADGVATLTSPLLDNPQTVTITGYCHCPLTFVDEPVDTITAYIDPVLTPACAGSGDPPPVGGTVGVEATITGELVFPTEGDMARGSWSSVPAPVGAHERQTAYLFSAAGDPSQPFQLPDPSTAVTPSTPGSVGYEFSLTAWPGDLTLYAVAGIEDDSQSPPTFVGWVTGVVSGVPAQPGVTTPQIYIPMDHPLDQAMHMTVAAPAPGPTGPDRVVASVAVSLGAAGYAIFPASRQVPLLPVQGQLNFVGLPSLDGDFTGSLFVASAQAVTGTGQTAPMSVVAPQLTNNTSEVIAMSGYVGVPNLTTPANDGTWDGSHLAVTYGSGSVAPQLTVWNLVSGNGLAHWLIAAPGGSQSITVPNLSSASSLAFPNGSLPSGSLNIAVYGGTIPMFEYGTLTYNDLETGGMSAYALNYFNSSL